MTTPFRPRIVVLIPAHNEERSILATLRSQTAQERRGDLIVVVADNCTDRTRVRPALAVREVVKKAPRAFSTWAPLGPSTKRRTPRA